MAQHLLMESISTASPRQQCPRGQTLVLSRTVRTMSSSCCRIHAGLYRNQDTVRHRSPLRHETGYRLKSSRHSQVELGGKGLRPERRALSLLHVLHRSGTNRNDANPSFSHAPPDQLTCPTAHQRYGVTEYTSRLVTPMLRCLTVPPSQRNNTAQCKRL
jgi:hypothetical protein